MLFPNVAAKLVNIEPIGLTGISEIRATYGGLFVGLGGVCLYSQSSTVFFAVGIAVLGAALGRGVCVLIDRSYAPKSWGYVFRGQRGCITTRRWPLTGGSNGSPHCMSTTCSATLDPNYVYVKERALNFGSNYFIFETGLDLQDQLHNKAKRGKT